MAVLDRPEPAPATDIPAPRAGGGIVRLPSPRRLPTVELVWPHRGATTAPEEHTEGPSTAELEALLVDPPPEGPAPAGIVEPRPEGRGRRFGTAAVAIAGGALSLIAATVPVDALAGGSTTAALTTDGSDANGVEDGDGAADGLPPAVDGDQIAASIAEAHQQVTDQVTAAEASLEAARQKATAEKAAAEKAAADKAAAEKAAAEKKAAAVTAQRECGLNESGLGAVKPYARTAAELLGCRYGKPTMYGVGGRGGASDHPSGRAIDFMVDRTTGDALAACALRNKEALGISYVIWRQRINMGSGWQGMEDRGGVTANHYDHVHVSFGSGGAKGQTLQGCG